MVAHQVTYNTSATDSYSVFGQCKTPSTTVHFACVIEDKNAEIERATLRGTSANDDLRHTYSTTKQFEPPHQGSFKARLFGQGGSDQLHGTSYDSATFEEHQHGGPGNDTINTNLSAGEDYLFGEQDNDLLLGGLDSDGDWMHGGNGNDVLRGSPGDDWMHGGFGNDILEGRGGDDVQYGGVGRDELDGEDGDDTLCETSTPVNWWSCPQSQEIKGGPGSGDQASVTLHPQCDEADVDVYGNTSVEMVHNTLIDWVDVAGNDPTPLPDPPSGCASIVGWGGI